ncbi:MAG: RAMP superfamily CRISPR-associated protein [Candidatus Cloacimonetes bacterium]|nr:RAMP superfamily CRISPR-associated protein [Candidatus Cloacimonadota bacterium]
MSEVQSINLITKATDPIYIGTGGYTIGRVDNTIVRDPISRIPKIPGTSLAGTWRYFMALQLQSYFKDEYRSDRKKRGEDYNPDHPDKKIDYLFNKSVDGWWNSIEGNRFAALNCAGQDDYPNMRTMNDFEDERSRHCGNCIVCKSFGYSKSDKSEQGLLSFTDLNILFFPVYTRKGTKWITSESILQEAGLIPSNQAKDEEVIFVNEEVKEGKFLNLGWLNLPMKKQTLKFGIPNGCELTNNQIVIVPDHLISQIINSNLEVRTSVSIDPNTGAAKDGALFTSEAIPRTTVFYGKVHIFERSELKHTDICNALCDSKQYYESLGIGGMTTRGFGRMKVQINCIGVK